MNITLDISHRATTKYNSLTRESREEINMLVDDLILTMPVEPTDAPAWLISEQREKEASRSGSTKNSSGGSRGRLHGAMSLLLILWVALCSNTSSASSPVSDKFLRAVMLVESGGRNVSGDSGRARGYFQFWQRTWDHVTQLRRKAGLPTYAYSGANNLLQSQAYARTYFQWLEAGLKRNGCKHPTPGQLYAAWNMGHAGFKRRGYNPARCPATTRRAVIKLNNLLK